MVEIIWGDIKRMVFLPVIKLITAMNVRGRRRMNFIRSEL
jgi:hypothetical protein